MSDKLFGDLRERVPELAAISDDDLVITLGNNYPGLLDNPDNEELAGRYKELTEGPGLIESTARGVGAGILDLGTQAWSVGQAAASAAGLDETAKLFGEDAREAQRMATDVAGPNADRFFPKVFRAGVSVLPVVAAGPMALPMAGAQSFGATFREAQDAYIAQGDSEEEAASKSFIPAMQSGAVTALVTLGGGALASKLKVMDLEGVNKIFKSKDVRQAIKGVEEFGKAQSKIRGLGRTALGAAIEGTEEGLDEFVSAYWVAAKSYDPNLTLEESLSRAVEAFYIGAAIGAPINLVQELARIDHLKKTSPAVAQKLQQKLVEEAQAQEAPQEAPDRAFAEANKDVPMGGRRPVSELPPDPAEDVEVDVDEDEAILPPEVEEEVLKLEQEEAKAEAEQAQAPVEPEPVAETTAPEPAPEATPEPVGQEEGSPFSQEDRKQQAIGTIKTLLEPLAGTRKQMQRSGGFVFYGRAGNSNKKVGDPNRTVLPTKTFPQYEKKLNDLIDEANKLAETLEPDPAKRGEFRDSLIEDAKQQIFTAPKSKRGSKTTANIDNAAQKVLRSPEGQEDILDLFLDYNRNVIELPKQGRNYQTDSKVLNSDSYSGPYKAFIDAVNTLVARSNNLGSTFKKVPAKQWEQTRRDPADLYRELLGPNAEGRDIRGEDFWDALTEAVETRIARFDQQEKQSTPFKEAVTKKFEGAQQVAAKDLNVGDTFNYNEQPYKVEVVEVSDDGKVNIVFQQLQDATTVEGPVFDDISVSPDTPLFVEKYDSKAQVEEALTGDGDNNQPFAANPTVSASGVSVETPTTQAERDVVQRAIELLPKIQRKLGGGKIKRILINRETQAPGGSGARRGDFGTVYLNPQSILTLERTGQGSLERVIIEEVIHNYTGMSIYHDWNSRGRPGTFIDYYNTVYSGIYDQLTSRQIKETIYYYAGINSDGNFAGDKVSVAEEAFRILTQRALTGEFSEQSFRRSGNLDSQGPLGRLLDLLARWWNGIQAGLMSSSPSIKALKTRLNRLLANPDQFYDRIDVPQTVQIGSSQVFLNFGEDSDTPPKTSAELSIGDNEGDMLAFTMRNSQIEFFSQQDVKLKQRTDYQETPEERVELSVDGLEGDFIQKLFALSEINLLEFDNTLTDRGVTTIPAGDAAYIQKQNDDAILEDSVHIGFHKLVRKYIEGRKDIDDTLKDQAMMFVFSRLANKARTFAKEKRGLSVASFETFQPSPGRKSFPVKGSLSTFTADFFKRIQSSRVSAGKFNPVIVTVDAPVKTQEEGGSTSSYDLIADPNADIPSSSIVNSEILYLIQKLANSNLLTPVERSILQYGFDRNFEYGWKTAYQREFNVKKSTFSMQYSQVQSKIAAQLALDESERLSDAMRFMSPSTRKIALNRIGEVRREAAKIQEAQEEAARIELPGREGKFMTREASMKMLRDAVNREGLVGAALPDDVTNNVANESKAAQERAAINYRDDNPNDKVKVNNVVNEESQKRVAEARNPGKSKFKQLADNVSKGLEEIVKGFKQYRFLDGKKYGDVIEVLRQFENVGELSQVKAALAIKGITGNLSEGQRDLFTDILVFRDLAQSIRSGLYEGKELPFGLQSKQEVFDQVDAHNEVLQDPDNEKVKAALARRKVILETATQRLQQLKLLPTQITDAENYFHRMTVEYLNAERDVESGDAKPGSLAAGFRTKKAAFQKQRKGSEKDYVTDFVTSESAVLSQAYAQILTNEKLNQLKTLVDQKQLFNRAANKANTAKLAEKGVDPVEFFKPFDTKIAIGFSKLQSLLKKGELQYNTKFEDVVEDFSQGMSNPDMFLFLQHLMQINSNGAGAAGMIFKNIQGKKKALREELGNEYETWATLANKSEDYVTWQPDKGNMLYRGTVVSDTSLEKWMQEADEGSTITLSPEQLRRGLVLGGKKPTWVIPKEVAQQLETFTIDKDLHPIMTWNRDMLAKWKFWKLMNPYGFFKYELNNTTGDFDIAFAYDPEIMTYTKDAWNDLWSFHITDKKLTPEIEELIGKGVLGSGYAVAELSEVAAGSAYTGMIGDYINPTAKKSGFTEKYKGKVSALNQVREDTLRLAAYRYFLKKLDTSSSVFGVSNPQALALIKNKKDKAAKLSRELIGDYGAISRNGKWLRQNAIPFYSWMEINLPRYIRLFQNTRFQESEGTAGRVAKVGAKKAAVSAAKAAGLASVFSLAVNLWNRAMVGFGFVDEDDKEVLEARKQQHLLLYSTEEGRVISVRFQGALTDALEYFGLGNIFETSLDVALTDETIGDALEQYKAEEGYMDGINRVTSGLTPFVKTPYEFFSKKRLYPSVFNQSPLRDRGEYLLNAIEIGPYTMGMNFGYRWFKKFPSKGVVRDLGNMIGYTTDTGEAAYQYIKAKEYQFMEEKGDERPSFTTTSKNDALYYYKKAKKFGDEASAKRWLAEYEKLGGTEKGLKRSVSLAAPLAKVSKSDRKEFLDSLTNTEKDILGRAESWYEDTFK